MSCSKTKNIKSFYSELMTIIRHDDETFSFELKCDDIKTWSPGNHAFFIVHMDGKEVGRKLSFASAPHEGLIRFTTRVPKLHSDYKEVISQLVEGEVVKISEPDGVFKLRREHRPVVLLSNGVGIAPMRSMVESFVDNQKFIPELLQINVDSKSDIYKDVFDEYKKQRANFNSYHVSSRAAYYGMLNHELKMMMRRHDLEPIIYIVGSDGFVAENKNHLTDVGFIDLVTDDPKAGCSGCQSSGSSNEVIIELQVKPSKSV